MLTNKFNQKAEDIITNHMYYAVGAGLLPLPLLDMVAVTAIQMDMLKQLANLYNVPFRFEKGKSYVTAIGGSIFARIGASIIKTIPYFGTIAGGVSMSALSGAMTYAVGQVFREHFNNGGDFSDMDLERAKILFKEELERGKKVAKKMEATQKKTPNSLDAIIAKIEKLGTLKERGFLTEKEFTAQKKQLLDSMEDSFEPMELEPVYA